MTEPEIISFFYTKSHLECLKTFTLLSDKGNEIAQYFLGSMLIMPIDNTINADFEKGLTYLMLSGKRGYIPALEYLGNLYAYSNLVEKNPKTAHTFFYLVSLSKENVDIGYHQIIEDEFKLSRNEIQSSIKNATECLEKGFDTCYIFN